MDIHPISIEVREFALLESRLSAGNLTLEEIRDIEDSLILKVPADEKMRKLVEAIFAQIADARKILIERKVAQLGDKEDLESKIQKLHLLHSEQSPEEAVKETVSLFQDLPLEEDGQEKKAVLNQLEELQFKIVQPIVQELDNQAICSNFASRMRQIAKAIIEQNSLAPLRDLNQTQQKEIYRYARGIS